MQVSRTIEEQMKSFSTSALDGKQWLLSGFDHFIPAKTTSETSQTGGLVRSKAGLNSSKVRKSLVPAGNRN
jgi:hypothetical protein